jgi:nucleoside-triphosphatase
MASKHSGRPGQYVLLLTGAPGVGKTTVIRRVAMQLEISRLRGFYTEEIREGGERRGFRLLGFQGQKRVIAHTGFAKSHRVGKYGVDVAAMDEAAALLAPDPAAKAYLVDEIGKMECLSERFVAAVRVLLAGPTPVVATVALRGGGFIAEAKSLPDALVWQVTPAVRDGLPARVKSWLTEKSASTLAAGLRITF